VSSVRVLVTGGAGFIGSHIVDRLVDLDHEVVVLDRRQPRADVQHVAGDVGDADAWLRAARGVDAVCHQAAKVGLGVDFGDVRSYVADNDGGTAAGLWALHHLRFGGRIVLASSMVVYGEGAYRCARHGPVRAAARSPVDLDAGRFEPRCAACDAELTPEPVDETAPVDPRNVYAATKLHQEHLCAAFGREHGVAVTMLRYHNVYGPRMPRDTPYAGVAAIFASQLAGGRPPKVFEDGRQTRNFIHVRDVARANVLALLAPAAIDGPLNIASDAPRTVLDLASALADAAGGGAPRPVIAGGYRLGDVRHVFASPARATEQLGFRADVPFETGVRDLLLSGSP